MEQAEVQTLVGNMAARYKCCLNPVAQKVEHYAHNIRTMGSKRMKHSKTISFASTLKGPWVTLYSNPKFSSHLTLSHVYMRI